MLFPALQVVGGLFVLLVGGEVLVRGATSLARAVRISPLVIGLTVVAFGTSAPEFAVTFESALDGSADLALGNVVGSNIANTLLILGLCAVFRPLLVSSQVIRYYVPLMIASSFLLLFLGLDGSVSRLDGVWLSGGLIAYNVWSVRRSRLERGAPGGAPAEAAPEGRRTVGGYLLLGGTVGLGLLMLAAGARAMVDGAVGVSRGLGVPELGVGLTIVALGTSLPELATSFAATVRGQRDIAVGNVVGSNLFNVLGVLGLASLVAPAGIDVAAQVQSLDLPFMIAAGVVTLPIALTGSRISRREGAIFLAYYVAYTAYVVLDATRADVTRTSAVMMTGFVIPLSAMALIMSWARWRQRATRARDARAPGVRAVRGD